MPNFKQWFADNGDNTLRLQYPLTEESIVFDVGGYKGWFTEKIHSLYGSQIYCFEPLPPLARDLNVKFKDHENIKIIRSALSDVTGSVEMVMDKDRSAVKDNGDYIVASMTMWFAMEALGVDHIDLLKINIEGSEYPLLEDMIVHNLVALCGNIQVQFHDHVPNHKERYEKIAAELQKTHHLTYNYPFVWENWEKI